MKSTVCTVLCLTALALGPALGQPAPTPGVPSQPPRPPTPAPAPVLPSATTPGGATFSDRLQNIIKQAGTEPTPQPPLTRFNLDFRGGTPRELVAAIEKAMGRPLNAIVPAGLEYADNSLPEFKMHSVDVAQLFSALRLASVKSDAYQKPGWADWQFYQTTCGFKTEGKITDDSIWYFYVEKPVLPPAPPPHKVCRFYSLTPYLDRGATVDDITTAIETGWKMLGDTSPPTISFHKDTKLLIAVGEPSKLETIDAVLKALETPRQMPLPPGAVLPTRPAPGVPGIRPAERPKGEN